MTKINYNRSTALERPVPVINYWWIGQIGSAVVNTFSYSADVEDF